MRTLESDSFGRSLIALLLTLLFLTLWSAWFLLARVAVYEVSDTARLEVEHASLVLQSPVDGRVRASNLALGKNVEAGDIMLELDSHNERLQLEEAEAHLAAIPPQIAALRAEMDAAKRARDDEQQASGAAQEQARAQMREADANAQFAEQDAARQQRLKEAGVITDREYVRARAEAQARRASADSFAAGLTRLAREHRTRKSDREVRLRQIQEQITGLEVQRAAIATTVDQLRFEIERRVVRAPIAGRLGEVGILRAGSVVNKGDKLGSIVPTGEVRVVAEFPPASAIGRIWPGQRARLRLQGFPWAQFGTLGASVRSVGSEVRDNRVRVELMLDRNLRSAIPIQHGLPGTVEVQIAQVTPATLALRTAGRFIGQH